MSKQQVDAAYVAAMKQHVAEIRHDVAMRMRRHHDSLARAWGHDSRDDVCSEPKRRDSVSSLAWIITLVLVSMSIVGRAYAQGRVDGDDADRDDEVELELDIDVAPIDLSAGASIRAGGRAPGIAEVIEAAHVAAGLDRDPTKSWGRRARAAALIPWVSVRAGWDANWREDDPDVGRSRDFEVRATWRLDRLVFEGREIQIASVDMARRRERRRLASRVIRAYFAWRKVTAAAARDTRFGLAAEAATAELDALTDGWFSERAKSPR